MKRRFVIGTEGFDKDQERRFREHLTKLGKWWHWIDNLWLLTIADDPAAVHPDPDTASEIRDFAVELCPTARVLVMEFPEDLTWSASQTRNAKGRAMSAWLLSPWGD